MKGKLRFFWRSFSYRGFLTKMSRPAQPMPGKGGGVAVTGFVGDFGFYSNL